MSHTQFVHGRSYCSGQLVAAEECALAGRVDQVVFEEVEVGLQLWIDEAGVDLAGDAVGDGLEEEGDWGVLDVWCGGG